MSARTPHVFLVPGFLGIDTLGDVVYFAHVREFLAERLAALGLPAEIHAVRTHPTASIRLRTLRLLQAIEERAPGGEPLHLIGHSTGGLDARLLCTPGARLAPGLGVEDVACRVRSVISISTPHFGTPLAAFFTTRYGAQLLGVLSLGTTAILRFGHMPVSVVLRLAALLVRLHGRLGRLEGRIAGQMLGQILGDFSAERRDELGALFSDMASDQALMAQLMPECMDLVHAAVADRETVRYGSVVTMAEPATLSRVLRLGLDPYGQATHALFDALRRLTSEMPKSILPPLDPEDARTLEQALGRTPARTDNDGIVPTLSQLHGELLHAARADHIDVIGHFSDVHHNPPHYDWLMSGSGFRRANFEAVWTAVAEAIVRAA
jgi:triacylglycerol lipase